ncbi:2,3-diaminopropionate biosynthesis protein SbnB [Marininema halotolerans]|uniref:Ornithine cyclodeaminase n=1 Tax=Marininema halotolerans TaxID=1155944 RepID=A0A1I6PWK0_9BACL|nr:2,3-diaminopropionate biosynthesis protein SbnB [Marininema halotolerans]SFS44559.1 ornithine cyclodeaminase [Marininema halotolerans]
MLYLNTENIQSIGMDWRETIHVIDQTVRHIQQGVYDQPIKPYLRFPDPSNRIIAMPAYIGADINMAGIKWIASFPKNIDQGIQRAHSLTILNNAEDGRPVAMVNTALVSGVRTASVTGLMIQEAFKVRPLHRVSVGIVGFGPIGQLHLQMMTSLLKESITEVRLYDVRDVDQSAIPAAVLDRTRIVNTWEEAYEGADVLITCTVSSRGYIDKPPKQGALLINVSLRDFKPTMLDYNLAIIVDRWEEVCRANTDIEVMHKERGLQKEETLSLTDVVCKEALQKIPADQAIYFNPMGMASFDIAIATYYYRQAGEKGVGQTLV